MSERVGRGLDMEKIKELTNNVHQAYGSFCAKHTCNECQLKGELCIELEQLSNFIEEDYLGQD